MSATMKAYLLESFDASPRMSETVTPTYADDEILIRILASSVNPVDRLVSAGYFREMLPYRFPVVLGRDVSGVVEAVGAQVTRFSPGDRVWGFVKRSYTGDGTFAEYVACPADSFVTAMPTGISALEAGVLGVAAVTAQACLDAVQLTGEDTVLVLGAAGGTGTFAVQLARATGARVVAVARPGAQADLLSELGAAEVLDWTTGRLAAQVREIAPDGVDALVDLARPRLGSARADESARQRAFADFVFSVAAPGGRVASTTNAVAPALLGDMSATNVYSNPVPEALDRVATAISAGSVRPVVSAVFDFDDIEEAFGCLDRSVTGKIALRISPEADARDQR
ncbi:MAG TPA: NADP-dependent oxidoreductase [Micromonosporaceae bacterium]|nr:NADP-dependent oxidoreductase [Micromonosporaceae bacterium]